MVSLRPHLAGKVGQRFQPVHELVPGTGCSVVHRAKQAAQRQARCWSHQGAISLRQVVDCGGPLPLWGARELKCASQGTGAPAQSRTLAWLRLAQLHFDRVLKFGRAMRQGRCLSYLSPGTLILAVLFLAFSALTQTHAAEANLFDRWFAAQAELKTWSADEAAGKHKSGLDLPWRL